MAPPESIPPAVLSAAIGRYPNTAALLDGRVASELLRLELANIPVINRAFAPMVRELRFDVSELAIATFIQARIHGKPLVLLPVVTAARFQQTALLCLVDSDLRDPSELAGRRVGVRAYSQTTGMWLRGILGDDYGVRPEQIRWVTFEDAHVPEAVDPPFAERAGPGQDLLAMLRAGELDAVIVGNDVPGDPDLRTLIPDPDRVSDSFWGRHGFVPINHMVTVRRELADRRPELLPELVRLLRAARAEAPLPANGRDPLPIGRAALQTGLEVALRYSAEQGLVPRRLQVSDLWEGLPPGCD